MKFSVSKLNTPGDIIITSLDTLKNKVIFGLGIIKDIYLNNYNILISKITNDTYAECILDVDCYYPRKNDIIDMKIDHIQDLNIKGSYMGMICGISPKEHEIKRIDPRRVYCDKKIVAIGDVIRCKIIHTELSIQLNTNMFISLCKMEI